MCQLGFKVLIARALPGTMAELSVKSGCAESTIRRWLHRMRAKDEAYISDWPYNVSGPTAYYSAGPGEDMPKPRAKTSGEYSKKWRKKAKREKRYKAIRASDNEKQLAKLVTARTIKQGDPMVLQFFGRVP